LELVVVARRCILIARLGLGLSTLTLDAAGLASQATVSVTPDGASWQALQNSSGLTRDFAVTNLTGSAKTYTLSCIRTGAVTSCSTPPTVTVPGTFSTSLVTVTFATGAPGSGTLQLKACDDPGCTGSWDTGTYNITVNPPIYTVAVGPDNQAQTVVGTIARTDSFRVANVGNVSDTYTLTCSTTGSETCGTISPTTSVTLAGGQGTDVTVSFTPGAVGTSGTLVLTATSSHASDNGSFIITNGPPPAPVVSLMSYSGGIRPVSAFDVRAAVATPAYVSMGDAHDLTLGYSAMAVRPTPVILVDVSNSGTTYPTTYSIQVSLAPSGPALTLLNGASIAYYAAGSGTTTSRLAAAIDAKANGLTSGFYPVNVTVTSYHSFGINATTVSTRLLVEDLSGSAFGAGWSVAGLQRIFFKSGSNAVVVDNGDGSVSYFDSISPGSFTAPAGDPSRLTWNPTASLYARAYPNGDTVYFRSDGRMSKVVDVTQLTRRTLTWTDTLLTAIQDLAGKTRTLGYAGGRLQTVTDPGGRVTTFSIDGSQRLYQVTLPNGDTTRFAYDSQLRLQTITDAAGGAWDYTYDSVNRIASSLAPTIQDYTGALVRATTIYLTAERMVWQPGTPGTSSSAPKSNVRPDTVVTRVTDPLGNVTKVAVDRFALQTKVVDALGQVTTITRDTLGNAKQISAPNGHNITRNYSGYLLTSETDNTTGESRTYSYNGSNQLQMIGGGRTRLDYFYHDGTQGPARMLKLVYAGNTAPPGSGPTGGVVIARHFPNAYGQDTLMVDGGDHRTRAVYAALSAGGNLLQVTDPKGHLTSYHYNAIGLIDTVILVTGAKRVVRHDVINRDTLTTDELGRTTRYVYTPLGQSRIVDPKGQVYKFARNALGLLVARHDLGDTTKIDSLKYDVGGNLRTIRTRRGDVITMTFDALGRLRARSGPDFPADSFAYGVNGAWGVAWNANGRDSVVFDAAGRPTFASQRMPDGATTYQMSYTYDSHGRLIGRSAPAGGSAARWVYKATLGTLDTLCGVGTCAAFRRDVERKADTITYNAGQSGAWSQFQRFDSLHMVTRDSFSVTQLATDFNGTWAYDSLMRLNSSRQSGAYGQNNYGYDAAGQLINACYLAGFPQTCQDEYGQTSGSAYSYDAAGNRTEGVAGALVGLGNRTQEFKNYWLSYDLNGNLIQKAGLGTNGRWFSSDTTVLQWNAVGQLTRVEKWPAGGAHSVTALAYDALGRRVAKTVNGVTTWFVYDRDQPIMDINAPSTTLAAEYAYLDANNLFAMRTPSWTGIALKNPVTHGVIGVASAQGGSEIKNYGFALSTAWGEVGSDTGTVVRFRLGGQEYDQETGLYHLGARYYDPQQGRFLSEDPAGIEGGLNLYAYAGNDPVNKRDPSGLGYWVCRDYDPSPHGEGRSCHWIETLESEEALACLGNAGCTIVLDGGTTSELFHVNNEWPQWSGRVGHWDPNDPQPTLTLIGGGKHGVPGVWTMRDKGQTDKWPQEWMPNPTDWGQKLGVTVEYYTGYYQDPTFSTRMDAYGIVWPSGQGFFVAKPSTSCPCGLPVWVWP
jgi:RHS repeat-associated protein